MTENDRARTYLAAVPGSSSGGRDNATIAAACKLVEKFDLPPDIQAELLAEWNRRANSPALPDVAVSKCLRSARERTAYQGENSNGHRTPPEPQPPAAPLPTEAELDAARDLLCRNESQPAARARSYLEACGIDPALCGWGLSTIGGPEATQRFGLPTAAAGIRFLIAVYGPDGTLLDVRRYVGPFARAGDDDSTKCLPWAKGHGSAKPYGWFPAPDVGAELLWVEGEKDCEAAKAHGFAAVSNTCGAGSAAKVAGQLPDELLAGRRFLLLFDHDDAGRDAAAKLAAVLHGRGCTVRIASWPEDYPQGFDLADFFTAGGDISDLRPMFDNAPAWEPPEEDEPPELPAGCPAEPHCLADFGSYVDRELSRRANRATKQMVSKRIAAWAADAGRLVWDPSVGGGYLVDDGRAVPLADDKDVGLWLALSAAGLNPTEASFGWLLADLTIAAAERGRRTRLSRWSYCDRGTATVYVSCGDRQMVRARPQGEGDQVAVDLVLNGTDGVLFARDACLPEWTPTEPVDPLTLAPFRCPLDTVGDYTAEVQRGLLRVWLIATAANLRPLPILAALGSKGSGKTTLARSVARLLLGGDADVVPLGDDARDFDTSVTSKPVHALDNVDAALMPPWFADRLALAVTGGAVERRALYTNAGVYRAPITASLVVTSRTAAYARTDVAERALPLLTIELEDAGREADTDLAALVTSNRGACLTWLAIEAAGLLQALPDAPAGLPARFVDFGRLVWADAQAEGEEEQARPRLLALRGAQATLVGEGNALLEAILAMAPEEEEDRVQLRGSTADILRDLQAETDVEVPFLGGGKAATRHLRELKGILMTLGWQFTETMRQGRHPFFALTGPKTRDTNGA